MPEADSQRSRPGTAAGGNRGEGVQPRSIVHACWSKDNRIQPLPGIPRLHAGSQPRKNLRTHGGPGKTCSKSHGAGPGIYQQGGFLQPEWGGGQHQHRQHQPRFGGRDYQRGRKLTARGSGVRAALFSFFIYFFFFPLKVSRGRRHHPSEFCNHKSGCDEPWRCFHMQRAPWAEKHLRLR